ncbi:Respiratory supercomplex factor 1, mitochondrial [Polyrhizophydium stewartii]|uniref:Respiratory supercomplex factor 1, mitochondrial n=1 Tax=Polyrhizophydium stewartii TaxID=2732419 RepID=A0ABR4NHQ7_9FUNG|nr:hypothetical protein HK105_005887 [Polyrhizophydium stewartii]
MWQRTKRKTLENPFVLPAVGLTVYAMYRMTDSLRRRDSLAFQNNQRFRIFAQGLALAAIAGGYFYNDYRKQEQAKQLLAAGSEAQPGPSSK